jgi:two-component system sensor histidine kinase BarA
MPYRSFSDILGETSLERKCRFLFGVCLFVLIAGSFSWYGSRTERLVYATTRATGRHLVDAVLLQYHLEGRPRGERPGQEPGEGAVKVGPAGSVELARRLQAERYEWRLLRPDASVEERADYKRLDAVVLDSFQAQQPATAEANAQPVTTTEEYREFRTTDGAEYHYYQPIRARAQCLDCHNRAVDVDAPRLAAGDLMAVVKVIMPDGATRQAINWNRAILLATAIITVFLAMLAAYAIVRYVIVKPLAHLREVSEEVRHGNVEARADIHTADEFEELGVAFNRMLRGLIESQEELQKANGALDEKVDELARANLNLYEMNRLKGDFLATMSHELRTPLNSIIGFSDVLGAIQSLDDKQRRYVENIRTSGRMLLEMINDILDLAKIEAGKMEVRPVTFRLEAVLAAQCDMVRPLAERKRIEITLEVDPEVDRVEQDQAKVQQVVANLLSNAVKFTPEGGRIDVSAAAGGGGPRGAEFLVAVADTGVGIADEDRQAIFEKFRQGRSFEGRDDAMTREFSGTGLGLSIVRELCRLLGGDVAVESQLGRGSRFTVRLPVRLAVADETGGRRDRPAVMAGTGRDVA